MRRMIPNPIFSGWCSDPSIVRVGEDYYMSINLKSNAKEKFL